MNEDHESQAVKTERDVGRGTVNKKFKKDSVLEVANI